MRNSTENDPGRQTQGDLGRLWTPAETATFLGLKEATLATWRSQGRHDLVFSKVGRKVMYDPASVRAWLASRTMTHTA